MVTDAVRAGRGAPSARGSVLFALLQAAASFGLLALSSDPQLLTWQSPATAGDLLALSRIGALTAGGLYFAASLWTLARTRRLLSPVPALVVLAIPYTFNWLWMLTSPGLIGALGRALVFGAEPAAWAAVFLGCTFVLAVFNTALFLGIGLIGDGRTTRGLGLYGLLLACAALAAAAPWIADAASSPAALGIGKTAWRFAAIVAAALSQACLWAETYLVTGALLDAIWGRRPTRRAADQHARDGLVRGAVFGGFFMALIQSVALALDVPAAEAWLARAPLLGVSLAGGMLFAFARTLVESFDGSAPFFHRLASNSLAPANVLRGFVVGAGIGLAAAWALPAQSDAERTGFGLLVGAAAYAGVDLLRDLFAIAAGRRQRLQTWRVYVLGALLGGSVGAALGWYFETSQLAVVFQKFELYAGSDLAASGGATRYVIYPWFSKWGAIDLGEITGGVKLFFVESLSGVIGWSLAAPLFSVNLVLLTALLERSVGPLRRLFTASGLAGVGEQALRVQRWGLWMAPVIYSFLRLSPDPTWYDQDGAVRSVVAALHALMLDPGEFRRWSLEVFLGLLAYDGVRILVWFDHMGLRVATLVNLSFVGGDALDETAARFVGHSARARVIPEGIRRFATWAPLLIPFYIPRGADWDYAWTGAEVVRAANAAPSAPVARVLLGYAVAAVGMGLALAVILLRERHRRRDARRAPAAHADLALARESDFVLANGNYALELSREGLGFSRVASAAHGGREIDLTRRPDDPLSPRGNFFYLRDLDRAPASEAGAWSLTAQPLRKTGPDFAISQPTPSQLRIVNTFGGVRATATIELAATDAVAIWRIQLENREAHARRLEITSYQELAIDVADAYRRHPQLSALYIGTRFVAPLGAILAHDRRLHGALRRTAGRPVAFHAVRADRDGSVRLTGYEDSRPRFIGSGSLRAPRALAEARARDPGDEGLLHSFDPCASLRVEVALEPRGSVEIVFVDGWVEDERDAPAVIARQLGRAVPDEALLAPALSRTRILEDSRIQNPTAPPFQFSSDGRELRIHAETPRPFTHVLASPLGHGAIVNSDGAIFSFAGNSQKNALTPFTLDTVPAAAPGQAIYVVPQTEALEPIRFPEACGPREIRFGRGYATFEQSRGELRVELEICVVPDAPVELRILRVENRGARPARCRVVFYFEMVLAELPLDSRGKLSATSDPRLGALFFANPDNDFQAGMAFAATSLREAASECVRARFVGGEARDLSNPFLVEHGAPDTSAPDDGIRIASFAGEIEVPRGGVETICSVLGQAQSLAHAKQLIAAQLPAAEQSARATRGWWEERLGTLRIETNLPEFDRLVNDWLPYQVQASRLWARAGSEQRSGAYGFRDQLQDVLPLLFHDPALARRQILLHAGQQFLEGDVLAWWHPSKTGATARERHDENRIAADRVAVALVVDETMLLLERLARRTANDHDVGSVAALKQAAAKRSRFFARCEVAGEHAALSGRGIEDHIDALAGLSAKPRGERARAPFIRDRGHLHRVAHLRIRKRRTDREAASDDGGPAVGDDRIPLGNPGEGHRRLIAQQPDANARLGNRSLR